MNELISVIMPSFNTAKYLADSVASVIAQTYQHWELIIIDDCSQDDSLAVIASFRDPRIRLLTNEKNLGAALSRNYGLREAKGKYIAFLDSDDLWHPQKLEKQLTFMRENHLAFSYTDYQIYRDGEWENCVRTAPDHVNKRKIYNYCYFSTITVMYDAEQVGLLQIEDLKRNNDYALWIQALSKVDGYRLPLNLSTYVKHQGSVSGCGKWELIKSHYILFRKGLHKNPVVSAILTVNNLFHGVIKKMFYKTKIIKEI